MYYDGNAPHIMPVMGLGVVLTDNDSLTGFDNQPDWPKPNESALSGGRWMTRKGFISRIGMLGDASDLSSAPRSRMFIDRRGMLGDLPTTITDIGNSISQAIQATTRPNSNPFTGPPAPAPAAGTIAGISITALAALGIGAFLLLKKR
jgi:hypothetical protein